MSDYWSVRLGVLARDGLIAIALVVVLVLPAVRRTISRALGRLEALGRVRVAVLMVLLILAPRLALLPTFEPAYETDVKEYVEKAALIADEGSPRRQEVRPDGTIFHRTLGYPLVLAGWYRITGTRSVRSAQAFNLVLASATSLLLLLLGRVLELERAGVLAAILHAFYLPLVVFNLLPYGETLAAVALVACVAGGEALIRRGNRPGHAAAVAAAAGLAGGLLAITRSELLWLPVLIAAFVGLRGKRRAPTRWLLAGVLLASAVVPLAVNHSMRAGYPGLLRTSSQSGLILYFGNNPIEVNGHGNATPDVVAAVRAMYVEDPTGSTARDSAFDWMAAHPVQVPTNVPKKLFHLWLAPSESLSWRVRVGREFGMPRVLAGALRTLAHIQSLAVLIFAAWGAWRRRRRLALIASLVLFHASVWSVLATVPRNSYPVEPLVLLVAGGAMCATIAVYGRAPLRVGRGQDRVAASAAVTPD